MTTAPATASVGASCPTCGESIEALDTPTGNADVDAFVQQHAGCSVIVANLADAVEAVLDGYGKSGQSKRMAEMSHALHAYRAVTR